MKCARCAWTDEVQADPLLYRRLQAGEVRCPKCGLPHPAHLGDRKKRCPLCHHLDGCRRNAKNLRAYRRARRRVSALLLKLLQSHSPHSAMVRPFASGSLVTVGAGKAGSRARSSRRT